MVRRWLRRAVDLIPHAGRWPDDAAGIELAVNAIGAANAAVLCWALLS